MQKYILKIALASVIILFLAAAPIPALNAEENTAEASAGGSELYETYYVNAQNGLKMRSAPSKDSDVVTLLPYGTEVTVIGTTDNGWYEVEYSNKSGYVAAKYMTKSAEANSDTDTIETEESASLASLPSETAHTTLGATSIIIALIIAIIIMIILAIFTAYSFLKKDKSNDEEYDDDNYDENNYGNDDYNNEESIDDEEYYDDDEE